MQDREIWVILFHAALHQTFNRVGPNGIAGDAASIADAALEEYEKRWGLDPDNDGD